MQNENTIRCAACNATRADVEQDAAAFGAYAFGVADGEAEGAETLPCCDEESLARWGSAPGPWTVGEAYAELTAERRAA